jgi:hypothetical protein
MRASSSGRIALARMAGAYSATASLRVRGRSCRKAEAGLAFRFAVAIEAPFPYLHCPGG